MIHESIGQIGHGLVIVSFVTALLATFAYFKTSQTDALNTEWRQTARTLFFIHFVAVIGVAYSLFHIIYNHYYEYHYAFSHASRALPLQFMISCFWSSASDTAFKYGVSDTDINSMFPWFL